MPVQVVGAGGGSFSLKESKFFFWEMSGLLACLVFAFGMAWWERHALPARNSSLQSTVSSAEALYCRLLSMEGADMFGSPPTDPSAQTSGRCDHPFVPVPDETLSDIEFIGRLEGYLGGTPMAALVPFLGRHDRKAAAFAVGIAKKESDWGRHAPTLAGRDCYNYWGYKGSGSLGSVGGYACFASPGEAVDTVVGRISDLVDWDKRDTPAKMVVWKCGSSCAWDDPANVNRWISDVGRYYHELAG